MQMKDKICLTGLLLGMNDGYIATNPTQSVLWESQGVLLSHIQTRGENVNSVSYCEVLLKLRDAIRRKRPGQLARGVMLHHGKARPHTPGATHERIRELQWELLEHPPYSPALAPIDLHLFGPLKKHLGGKGFVMKRLKRRCGNG
jgi:histone-lysine N-methyltransferase SETMAR